MTTLEEASHTLITVEYDPLLYEDLTEMIEYSQQALKQAAHEATVLLYSPSIDSFLEDLVKSADRVFHFKEGPRDTPSLLPRLG
jgi:hypothetical protein